MAIMKDLEVTVCSDQQPCIEYEYPSQTGRFETTAIKYVISTAGAGIDITLKSTVSFKSFNVDALLFDIHFDGRHVHSGILTELDDKAIVRDITRGRKGVSETRAFIFADLEARTSEAESDPHTQAAAFAESSATVEPPTSEAVDPPSGPRPILSGPWQDLIQVDREKTRYLAPEPGSIHIQVYRAKDLSTAPTSKSKNARSNALTRRSGIEHSERLNALRDFPTPSQLDGHEIKRRNMPHIIEFGSALDVDRVQNLPSMNKLYLDPIDEPWASFVFHYRSQDVLEAWDVRLPRGVGVPWHEREVTGQSVFDTEEHVFDRRADVFDTRESVFDTRGDVLDTEGVFDTGEDVSDTGGSSFNPRESSFDSRESN